IEAAPGSDEYAQELAELGAVRYVLALTKNEALDGAERTRLLARAKAHGHGLRIRNDDSVIPSDNADRPTFTDALGAVATATPPPVEVAPRERKDTSPET